MKDHYEIEHTELKTGFKMEVAMAIAGGIVTAAGVAYLVIIYLKKKTKQN